MNNSFSLLKIVNGFSRTLNIANQIIPLYKQVKPLIQNSNKLFSNINNVKQTLSNNVSQKNITTQTTIKKIGNSPTFFQ